MENKMISKNINEIKSRIENACKKCGRDKNEVKLLGVTKTHPIEKMEEAIRAGIEFIGENKIQDAEKKVPNLSEDYKEFHFIGHLQSNKINKLMKLRPDLIHSIDKISTAQKLNNYCVRNELTQNILIEVNTSGEETKNGIQPANLEEFINELLELKNLKINGLMTIGTRTDDENEVRRCFRELKQMFEHMNKSYNLEMDVLSMGMTNDFELAIEEGSTIVRIGSAIFGQRDYSKQGL
jgi:pyridoxal phosphate enzyme (YggS family)